MQRILGKVSRRPFLQTHLATGCWKNAGFPCFSSEKSESSFPSPALSSSQPSTDRKEGQMAELLAAFTCNKCGARTGRSFSKVAYERGIVIARCSNCNVQHLISDQLGWFGKKSNIEDILRERGEEIRKGEANGVLNISPEDLQAWGQPSKTRK